jgi:hypothetical protein
MSLLPPLWRRLLCSVFGHWWGCSGIGGLLEFPVCRICGRWGRYAR